jgi:hypothetical protein
VARALWHRGFCHSTVSIAAAAQSPPMTETQTRAALLRGEIDGVVIVSSWVYAAVRRLLEMSEINLNGLPRAGAHVALYQYLTKLVLPVGVGDMAA